MLKYQNVEYHCSMELTLELIGGKWKSLILGIWASIRSGSAL